MGPPMATRPCSLSEALASSVPLALWPVAATPARSELAGRYLPGPDAYAGALSPELARRIITEYTRAGDLILDPICGIGVTVVEAAALGRRAIGVERQDRWAQLAIANCEHILAPRAWPLVEVITADVRRLADVFPARDGTVDLVVICSPADCDGALFSGTARPDPAGRLPDAGTAMNRRPACGPAEPPRNPEGVTEPFVAVHRLLRPGGLLVAVTSNTRRRGRLLDRAGLVVQRAQAAGFGYLQHVIALHAAICDDQLVAPPPFRPDAQARTARRRGPAAHLLAHQDVLVFQALPGAGQLPGGHVSSAPAAAGGGR